MTEGRVSLWKGIVSRSMSIYSPQLLLGDFNALRLVDERRGKVPPTQKSMEDFNRMVIKADLTEMSYIGLWFTWDHRQLGKDLILSKIDRGFCKEAVLKWSSNAWIEIISYSLRDHKLLCSHFDVTVAKRKAPLRRFGLPLLKAPPCSMWSVN